MLNKQLTSIFGQCFDPRAKELTHFLQEGFLTPEQYVDEIIQRGKQYDDLLNSILMLLCVYPTHKEAINKLVEHFRLISESAQLDDMNIWPFSFVPGYIVRQIKEINART